MFTSAEWGLTVGSVGAYRMDVEQEIRDLKRRVGDLEGAMNVMSGQVSQVHPDLMSLSAVALIPTSCVAR